MSTRLESTEQDDVRCVAVEAEKKASFDHADSTQENRDVYFGSSSAIFANNELLL
jgi:hypothetical protein